MISELYQTYLQSSGVETDTRKNLQNKIFFALKGDSFDGNSFASNAIENGAILAIIDNPAYKSQNTLLVEDVLSTLQALGLHHRRQLGIPIIAITGSNGKTTTKELMHTVLTQSYRTSATVGNLNNHIGIPLTLLSMPLSTEIGIVEMGANHIGEIQSYCQYTEPDYGLITNIGKAHIEGFGSIEGIQKGKGELYDYIREKKGTVFVHADDKLLMSLSEGIQRVSYGTYTSADLQASTIYVDDNRLQMEIEGHRVKTQLTGDYNSPNVLAALCVGRSFDVPLDKGIEAIEKYRPDNSRSQILKQHNNTIILDAYNANPTSMKLALENFAAIEHSPKIACIGGMKELGITSQEEHQAIIDLTLTLDIDTSILVGEEFGSCEYGSMPFFTDSSQAGEYLASLSKDIEHFILIKGSRSTRMEEILKYI